MLSIKQCNGSSIVKSIKSDTCINLRSLLSRRILADFTSKARPPKAGWKEQLYDLKTIILKLSTKTYH